MEREVEIKFKAYIRGGEHIVNVDNDKSLMEMFRLNTNQNKHVDPYVDLEVLVYVPPYDDSKAASLGNEDTMIY